jgi:hypothetical protein
MTYKEQWSSEHLGRHKAPDVPTPGVSTLAQVSVLGREQFPVPLGDDLDGTVDHFEGGLVVDRVRRA